MPHRLDDKNCVDEYLLSATYITRAETMTMINRVLHRLPENSSDLTQGMIVWPDNPEREWFYLAVQEATNSHNYKSKGNIHETWTGLSTNPDWKRYED